MCSSDLNIHGVLHAILERARFEEIIVANSASLPRGFLPKTSKNRAPRFTREEVWQLLTDERIEPHVRVFYALMGLGGMRLGEASGRRWRDLDRDAAPLAALSVATQYEDNPLKTAEGEHTAERLVPVHPALGAMLDDWRTHLFAVTYGRHPQPNDWLVPDPRTGRPRTTNQAGKALYRDCERTGIPKRGCHAFRRAFISLARSDGARGEIIETITHNARGSIVDVYTSYEWAPLCAAVSALRFDLHRADVVSLPRAVAASAGGSQLDALLDASAETPLIAGKMGGGGGNRTHVRKCSSTASTCVVCDLKFALGCAHKQARTNASGSSSRHCAEPDSQ